MVQIEKAKNITGRAIETLMKALEAGKSEKLKAYLSAMARFHNYSWANTLLIQYQYPTATHVAGFHSWQRLGRYVKKGSKGIAIFAPILFKKKTTEEDDVVSFRTVYIFDVSQTKGKPLPEFSQVSGDPSDYIDRLKQYVDSQGIKLEYYESGLAEGMSCGGVIRLKKSLGPAEQFSVLVHETTHEILHRGKKADQKVLETEAEAVAFVVSQAIGLDTDTASSDYIQLNQGTKETLMESLGNIQKTASQIITAITED